MLAFAALPVVSPGASDRAATAVESTEPAGYLTLPSGEPDPGFRMLRGAGSGPSPTLSYVQHPDCDYSGVSFSNFNSTRQPWIHRDDYNYAWADDVIEVRFWGGMWLEGANCDFSNLESVTINFYEWVPGGPCGCNIGALLNTNTIPTSDLHPILHCTGGTNGEHHYALSATLPVPFQQVDGAHYVIEIGGNLVDPDGCFFYWSRPGDNVYCTGYSVNLDTGQCVTNDDGAFALFTARVPMGHCGAEITYDNGDANLMTAISPMTGWDHLGFIDDFSLPQDGGTVFNCFSMDMTVPDDPFPLEAMRIQVYDISEGGIAGLGAHADEIPLFDHTVTLANGDFTFQDSGYHINGIPMLRLTATLPTTDLGAGSYGVFITFPGHHDLTAFWTTAPIQDGECAHIWSMGEYPPDDLCPSVGSDFNCLAFHFGYTLTGPCGDPAAGSCYENNGTPGCDNLACCETVCAVDPYCCDVEWDALCVDEAVSLCVPPPANDDCGDILILELQHNVTHVLSSDNAGATDDCPAVEGPEAWHAFSLQETMDLTIEYCSNSPAISVVSTVLSPACPCPGELNQFLAADVVDVDDCGNSNTTLHFYNVPPGNYYYPVVAGPGAANGPYELHVTGNVPTQPLNDDCLSALIDFLPPCSTRTWSGNATGATNDCPDLNWPDVWHAFSIPTQMDVTIDYCGTPDIGFFYWEFLYPDCTCGQPIWGVSNYDECANGRVTIEFPNLPAGTYYHATPYYENTAGVYEVTITTGMLANPANGHGYCSSSDFMTAPDAEAWAQSHGGHLVTISDQAEQQWLIDTFGGDDLYLIGLTDSEAYGGQEAGSDPHNGWVWMSGASSSYRNWAPGEPNDQGGSEDFVLMNWDAPGQWNDVQSSTVALAIAEVVPCPADLDGDGAVGIGDFLMLLAVWGASGGPADLDGDGTVGIGDFLLLLAAWGPCPG
jgi:hypothetical protein